MRRPSARMQPHTVTATYNSWGADMDGGRRVVGTRTASGLACFVQPGKARTIIETADETGLRRVTEFNPTQVYFVDDPGLSVDDLLTWVDAAGRTHTYRVVGYYPPCGTAVVWHAACEERI